MKLLPIIACQCGRTILVELEDLDPDANRDRAQYVTCPACERVNSVTPYLWTSWLAHGIGEAVENVRPTITTSADVTPGSIDQGPPPPSAASPLPVGTHAEKGAAAKKALEVWGTWRLASKKLGVSVTTFRNWLKYNEPPEPVSPLPSEEGRDNVTSTADGKGLSAE